MTSSIEANYTALVLKLKFASYLSIGIAFSLAVLVLNLGLSTSIYPDEIAYLKVNARIITDSWLVYSLFPFCASSQNLSLPLSLLPGALVAQSILGGVADTKVLRLVGTAFFILFGLSLATIAWLSSRKEGSFSSSLFPAMLPLLLGVFPFIGALTRPEITINACAALLLILFLVDRAVKNTVPHNLFYLLLFSIISSFLLLQHPKAIFFVPYIAAVAWLIFRNRSKWAFAAVGLFVATLSIQAYSIFKKKMYCPEIPLEAISKFNNYLDPLQLFSSPMSFLSEVFFNYGTFNHYIDSILFQQTPAVRWLPSIEFFTKYPMHIAANVLIYISFFIFFAMLLAVVLVHFFSFIREPKKARSSIVLLLALPAFAVAGLQSTKNFYDSAFLFPLCSLVLVFGMASLEKIHGLSKKVTGGVALLFALVAIDSQIVTLNTFSEESFSRQIDGPSLSHQRFQEAYSTGSFNEAVEGCNLTPGPETERLVLDDLMYFKFKGTKNPIFMTYFFFQWSLGGAPNPVDFIPNLRKAGATGAIVACSTVPEPFRMQMRSYSGFCCLKKSDIEAGALRRESSP